MIIYLAGPLFTEAERAWMREFKQRTMDLAARIGAQVEVKWPWELISQSELQVMGDKAGREIFQTCVTHLETADMVIALLDGPTVDDGTAWEIGFFYSRRQGAQQPIIGVRTDIRNSGEFAGSVANAMIEYSCDRIARSQDDALQILETAIAGTKPQPL